MKNTLNRKFIILIIIGLASFVIIGSLIFIEGGKIGITEKVDYVIVLGARLYGDKPAPALEERLKTASKYLQENEEIEVVVTGGQGGNEDIPEAEAMAKYLIDNGIHEDRIITEDKSTSTYENFQFSLNVLRGMGVEEDLNVLIVTNDYHLLRSKFLAERLGMTAYGLPAKTPSSTLVQAYIREYFAVIKSFLVDRQDLQGGIIVE